MARSLVVRGFLHFVVGLIEVSSFAPRVGGHLSPQVRDQVLRNHNYSDRIRQIEIGPRGVEDFPSLHYLGDTCLKIPRSRRDTEISEWQESSVLKVKRRIRFSFRCPLTPLS